jgi:tetratricopeptide (TPR) repeat protein
MRDYSLLFGLAALGLIVGCQQAPAPPRSAEPPKVPPTAVVRGAADQLMERGEYAKAADKYQEAVALAPDDMSLRYLLGTAYSHLGKRREAAEQFQWVVNRGDATQEYYRAARKWLASAGLLQNGRTASSGIDASLEGQAQEPTMGKIAGPLEWPGVNSRERLINVRVTLTGEDDGTKSVSLSRPFRLGERYEFRDLAPGKYRLVAKSEDGAPAMELWDQHVIVEAGQVTQMPLSASNSKVGPDKFPGNATK